MWQIKKFNELTIDELYSIMRLRVKTFVVEQNRIYQELDNQDQSALHLFNLDENGEIVAYARIFLVDNNQKVSFGRVVTSDKVRGQGFGGKLLDQIMEAIQKFFPNKEIVIEAQVQVQDFYKRVGFKSVGEPFIYNLTPHVKMIHEGLK